jgi:hypothetical protein
MPDDLKKRIFIAIGAASLPMLAPTLDSADSGDGLDSGDAGEQGRRPDRECVAVDTGEESCPEGEEAAERWPSLSPQYCVPSLFPGESAVDGECCYRVTTSCAAIGCGCEGRPLRIEGRTRVADLAAVRGWIDARQAAPDLRGLTRGERRALARHWASVAVNEHGSIAAFHRAGIELLAHGAPADLVRATQAAGLDEVRHAKMAFTLASHFAGAPIGPGELSLPSIEIAGTLAELAARVVEEGCVEETLSAAAAAAMLSRATDPAVRSVLEAIVRDENRHAALAWRTARWAVATGGEDAREAVAAAFAHAPTLGTSTAPPALARFGMLGDDALARAASRARVEIVRPAAAVILVA